MVFDALVSDPERLDADVFAPVLPTSTAKQVSRMTRVKGADGPVGVVMRSCQIRALVELIELNQVDMENLVIIGVDCPGTFTVNKYGALAAEADPTDMILAALNDDKAEGAKHIRPSCLACQDPAPSNADIIIGIFGADIENEVHVMAVTEAGEALVKDAGLKKAKDMASREKAWKRSAKPRPNTGPGS